MQAIKTVSIIYSTSREIKKTLNDANAIISDLKIKVIESFSIEKLEKLRNKKSLSKSDLILVIGGDGTMIGSIRKLYDLEIPFLGINLGRVGFLTDINPRKMSHLSEILKGRYTKEKRPIYLASFSEKNEDIFVNETVIHSGSITNMVDIELLANKQQIYSLRADGLIISSSTGSTAYSYSGGGPIISPDVSAFSLLPMFSHSSSSHSLVLSDKKKLKIKIEKARYSDIDIVLDGKNKLKYQKDGLEIAHTQKSFYLYHPKDYNYFDACRTKLGWSLPIEKFNND